MKKNIINLCFLILCFLCLSGCEFPIKGFHSDLPSNDLITGSFRILASIVVYVILLSVLATIPLFINKSFKITKIYRLYKLFWLVASLVFSNLLLLLFNVEPTSPIENEEYMSFMFVLVIAVLLPTLLPAIYQNHAKNNN